MSRRAYKTINLPLELVEWLDAQLAKTRHAPSARPLGLASRDEFCRAAVTILAAAVFRVEDEETAIDRIERIRRRWESRHEENRNALGK